MPLVTDLPQRVVCECGNTFDASSPVPFNETKPDAVPKPGALTLCFRCARLFRFTAAMGIERCDIASLPADEQAEVRRAQSAIHRFRGIPS